MNKAIKDYKPVQSYYADMMAKVRDEVIGQISHIVTDVLGGRICLRHYHEWSSNAVQYTFFEVDGDGYGRELSIDTIVTDENGNIGMYLSDNEDCYNPYWELSDLTHTDALYLLEELERVIEELQETGAKVVTDYDPDYDPDDEE